MSNEWIGTDTSDTSDGPALEMAAAVFAEAEHIGDVDGWLTAEVAA